jgi:peptidoglycan/LPS O-acetylase OafA/YrhL
VSRLRTDILAAWLGRGKAGPAVNQHIPALTGLRFVLALWVILHHLTGKRMMLDAWAQSLPAGVHAILRGGYLAVGAFFVLSGFVLALSYGSTSWNSASLMRYGVGRFARLYPTYLLTLVVIAPFAGDYLFQTGAGSPLFSQKATQLTIYGFALQGWSKPVVHWNTPAWSLSCELFFYVCFPLIALCLPKSSRFKALAAAGASLLLPHLMKPLGVPPEWKPLYHLADFLLGIGAAGAYEMLRELKPRSWRNGFWLYAPAFAAGAFMIVYPQIGGSSMNLNRALRPVHALLIVGLALGGGLPARMLSTRFATYLGKASYCMYILHIPLLWWYKRTWLHESGYLSQGVSALVYLVGVVAISALVSRIVEEPANRRIREWFRTQFTWLHSTQFITKMAAGEPG